MRAGAPADKSDAAARPEDAGRRLVVGTAGHIDHGKSALVRALTGVEPDRLPEEQARGMTIDLGFVHARLDEADLYLVDVPGHERFIHNMLAGATGIDAALLVVAADDGVMPQTREHAEVLSLLEVRCCVLALTKCDLVDPARAETVGADARRLLDELGLTPVATIHTSALTGAGLDELRACLARLARRRETGASQEPGTTTAESESRTPAAGTPATGTLPALPTHSTHPTHPAFSTLPLLPPRWFRLPIDRSFTIAGRGTVVTGTVMHGEVTTGDELELWPGGQRVRVRGLQTHGAETRSAAGRLRLAVNLAGVDREQVGRGSELATPGYLSPSRCCDVLLRVLRMSGNAARQRLRVRVHTATSEALGELRLRPPEWDEAAAGGPPAVADLPTALTGTPTALTGLPAASRADPPGRGAQLLMATPLVVAGGQPFILRDESGQRTLGGGVFLTPHGRRWNARHHADGTALRGLLSRAPAERLSAGLRLTGWQPHTPAELAVTGQLPDAEAAEQGLAELVAAGRAVLLEGGGRRHWLATEDFAAVLADVRQRLTAHQQAHPRSPGIPRSAWPAWMPRACPERFRPALADALLGPGRCALVGEHVLPHAPSEPSAELPPGDAALYKTLLTEIAAGGFQPPGLAGLRCRTERNERRLRELVELAVARGALIELADGIWLHAERWRELEQRVCEALTARGGLTVAEIRSLLNSTRKYVVPICERLDALGVTRREGDLRRRGPRGQSATSAGTSAEQGRRP